MCPNCGSDINDKQAVCLRCGYILNNNLEEKVQKKRKSLFLHKHLFLTIALIILTIFGGYKIYENYIKLKRIIPVSKLEWNDNNYVNDLYKSDERYYNYLLKGYQKEIYRNLLEAMKKFEKKVPIDNSKINSEYITEYINTVYNALANDHPELIQVSTISYVANKNDLKEIEIVYAIKDNKTYQKYLSQVLNIVNTLKEETKPMDDYHKVKYVYEFLATRNSYGSQSNLLNQSAITAFLDGYFPVCYGYAKASQIILQNIGIDSILVTGDLNGGSHAWNFVKLDNQYYYFDVTMSNGRLDYSGFLTKKERKYTLDHPSMVPWILGKKYK